MSTQRLMTMMKLWSVTKFTAEFKHQHLIWSFAGCLKCIMKVILIVIRCAVAGDAVR